MEGSKIKNIVLLILLIVNVFLLVQVAEQERRSAQYEAETRAGAVEVLARQNISLRMEKLPAERSLPALVIPARDKAGEEAMAAGLLGAPLTASEQGGPAVYEGAGGEGLFFSNGRFSFTFTQGVPLDGAEPERHAVRLMRSAGYDAAVVSTEENAGTGELRVNLRQLWAGEEVFNCGATLTYRDGALRAVEGQRLVGAPEETADASARGLSVSTVLIRFLGGVRENFYLLSEIRDLRLGYQASMEASGAGTLTPVWLVVTDVRSFYVDAVNGSLSIAE